MVVESRCKAAQEKLLQEYSIVVRERYGEISKGGPLEVESLMEIHDTLWSEIKVKLHDEVRLLLTTEECTLKMVTDQLEKQLIQFQWEMTDEEARVRKVVGGVIFPLFEENRNRSLKFCNQIITKLYTPIRRRVQTTTSENTYTAEQLAADVKSLWEEYDAKSVGPEKWNVRAQMQATIEQNDEFFQKLLHEVPQHARERKRLTEETFKRKRDEEIFKKMEDSKKYESIRKARADEEIKKMQQSIKAEREQETAKEIDDLKAQIKEREQKQKEQERKIAEAYTQIRSMEESLLKKKEREAEEGIKQVKQLREKEGELYKQQLLIERLKADHKLTVYKIDSKNEQEKRLKELAKEEARITINRLDRIIQNEKAEKEAQTLAWKKKFFQKEEEKAGLSCRIDTLTGKVEALAEEKETLTKEVEVLVKERETLIKERKPWLKKKKP